MAGISTTAPVYTSADEGVTIQSNDNLLRLTDGNGNILFDKATNEIYSSNVEYTYTDEGC